MSCIMGVDGCKNGWVVIRELSGPGRLEWEVVEQLREVFDSQHPPKVVAVDIPIGLPRIGSRECDLMARRLLAPVRSNSVFPAPVRSVVSSSCYADANAARRRLEGKGMSIQAWAICPKIQEVDGLLRENPELLDAVLEVHPEVCFYYLAGGKPMQFAKRRSQGRSERLALLTPIFGEAPVHAIRSLRAFGAKPDDVLDAFAALWTVRRVIVGQAVVLPALPPQDAFGLPMRMVA